MLTIFILDITMSKRGSEGIVLVQIVQHEIVWRTSYLNIVICFPLAGNVVLRLSIKTKVVCKEEGVQAI
jgi:hypothetical protein